MRKQKDTTRKLLGMLILVGFLFSQCFSFFGPPKSAADSRSNIYSYYAPGSAIPVTQTESALKFALQLFFISIVFFLLQGFRPKTRKPLITSNYERNYFYRHVTINAP